MSEIKSFERLVREEDAQLQAAGRASDGKGAAFDPVPGQPGSAEEPWLAFTNRDRVGLALSGGGIRSATFNLGLLQAMRQRGVLDQIDYLSTVSGGGYIGGFWTAWRHRSTEVDGANGLPLIFPKQTQADTADARNNSGRPSPKEIRERPEIRHLREFSRFLMPRVGFTDAEMWNGIVAIVFGLLPSLAATLAVIGAGLSAWLLFNTLVLHCQTVWAGGALMFALHGGINVAFERAFRKRGGAEAAEIESKAWLFVTLALSVLLGCSMGAVCYLWDFVPGLKPPTAPAGPGWNFDPGPVDPPWGVFIPALAWLVGALVLLFVRLFCNSQEATRTWHGTHAALAVDRGIARCLIPAVVWSTLGGLWLLAIWLRTDSNASWMQSVGTNGGFAAVVAALFAGLRHWLIKPVEATNSRTWLRRLKPVLPQLLAYAAVAALFVLVAQGMLFVAFDVDHTGWMRIAGFGFGCLAVILFALRVFDLSNVGLHEFYRSRIARCFLGAAHPETLKQTADQNRQTNERQRDDLLMDDLFAECSGDPTPRLGSFRSLRLRPIHLVCCAANHLAGDPLGSLHRGARSAVLSQRGVTLGNETANLPQLRFSSALTASAAAFNSNMGSVSMHLGLPVAFLMTALNLRLGLWVPHPRNPNRQRPSLPGLFFFREMFGLTLSDSPPAQVDGTDPADRFKPASPKSEDRRRYLHLSDGAHFENLALYELVRRHCRYVIVSDCGADPRCSFDDLANTIRRVREDFGIEIELDTGPLRPGPDGYAQQHVVAGVIHYDGVTGCDKGTLLYFKPTLTGNEPCDVLQYKTRNPVFPQETTADQFYDEAQWESYHRLGEHSGYECFRFVDNLSRKQRRSPESIFHFARQQWLAGWAGQNDQFLALTARCSSLEAEIRDHAPAFLRDEFFPEVADLFPACAPAAPPTADEETRSVYFLMLVMQVKEDAWLTCRLDSQWSHPLNQGWMSYLHRWASTPSFQRWWPILRPIYSPEFREFVKQRFHLQFRDIPLTPEEPPASIETRLRLRPVSLEEVVRGFAWRHWARSVDISSLTAQDGAIQSKDQATRAYEYELLLPTPVGRQPLKPLQVGVVLVTIDAAARCAHWTTNEFYVPPPLEGAGFIGRFLDALLREIRTIDGMDEVRVTVLDAAKPGVRPDPRPDPASRARRMQLLDFYKSRRFDYDRGVPGQTAEFNQLRHRLH